jgi:hypothetical protein
MTDTRSEARPPRQQYTAGFLAAAFGLTPKEADHILDKANGDRIAAAEMARLLRKEQP